jgi:hypothetical protein
MVCAGSVSLIERLVAAGLVDPNTSSIPADEGTAAHQVRGDCLTLGIDAYSMVGSQIEVNGRHYPCTTTMADCLQPGMDWLREQPGEMIVEHQVDLSRWMPGQFGTLDTAIINRPARSLIIDDLKYGAGVAVSPVRSRQLRIYALGVVDNFDLFDAVDTIHIVIDQPRKGGMKHWSLTMAELLAFGEELRAAALAVDAPDATLVPSEKGCEWCPVAIQTDGGCQAYTGWMHEILCGAFEDLSDDAEPVFMDLTSITPEHRYRIVQHSHLALKWLERMHEHSRDAALLGKPDPGSKVVDGPEGDRYFTDPETAERLLVEALGESAFTKSLIGIPAAQKELKPTKTKTGVPDTWLALNALIHKKPGKPVLVPASDERPSLISNPVDRFDDLS